MFIKLKDKETGIKVLHNTAFVTRFTIEGGSIFVHSTDNLSLEYVGDALNLVAQLEAGKELFKIEDKLAKFKD